MKKCIPVNYRFVLHGDFVMVDEKPHFIASTTLADLYGLNWHECSLSYGKDNGLRGWVGETLHLYPIDKGDYKKFLKDIIYEKELEK